MASGCGNDKIVRAQQQFPDAVKRAIGLHQVAFAWQRQGSSRERVLEEVEDLPVVARLYPDHQQPALRGARAPVSAGQQVVHLAVRDGLDSAGPGCNGPRENRRQQRGLLPRAVAPMAADGAEADSVGEGAQPA